MAACDSKSYSKSQMWFLNLWKPAVLCKLKKLTNARDAVFEIIFRIENRVIFWIFYILELVGIFKEAIRNFTLTKKPKNVMSQRSGIYWFNEEWLKSQQESLFQGNLNLGFSVQG